MNIVQCRMCNKPFQSLGGRICPACLDSIDKDFVVVRDYIYEHPGAHIDDVSEETEVAKAVILHLLKEGRLQLDNPDSGGILLCEVCKKPISSGRMCDDCKGNVASTMQKSITERNPEAAKSPEKKQSDTRSLKHGAKVNTR